MAADGAGQRTVRLSNGTSMPLLGLGTGPPWSAKGDAAASVRAALSSRSSLSVESRIEP